MNSIQLVSPILNDLLASVPVSGEDFLAEFLAAHSQERRWVARRSSHAGLRGTTLSARFDGTVIVAEATLAPGFFADEARSPALLRVPRALPHAIGAGLLGRPLRDLIGHPLIGRATSIIESFTMSVDGRERLVTYSASPEPLLRP